MAKGIKRKVNRACRKVEKEIAGFASRGRIAAALASEGYNGGYLDALYDVLLVLDGCEPNINRQRWWRATQ